MKKLLPGLLIVLIFGGITPSVWADRLQMKNGQVVEGKFLGGTEDTIRFQTENGVFVYQIKGLIALTFSADSSLQPGQEAITIKSGTRLYVQIMSSLDSITSKEGERFSAILKSDILVSGAVIAPKGTIVHGEVVKAEHGKYGSALVITLQELVLEEKTIPVVTTNYALWDKPKETTAKIMGRTRVQEIPAQTSLEFKTIKPVTVDLSK